MPEKTKWIEISTEPSELRYKCLSEQLKKQGIENSFEAFSFNKDDEWQALLDQHLNTVRGVKIGRGLGEDLLKSFPNHSVHINKLGAADCLVKEDGGWWPRSASYEALLRVFSGIGDKLDFSTSALIVGAGAMARTVVGVLFREGFKHFGVTALDEERGVKLIQELRKVYFGAEFEFIPREELILLPGLYGFLANTTPSTQENELLKELSYFNFFIPNGVAMDLYLKPTSGFIQEAQEIGATTVAGYEVAAAADLAWAKWVFDVELNYNEYLESLKLNFQSKV